MQPAYKVYPRPYFEAKNYIDKEVIYIDFWDKHFGHFMLESLPRIWLARTMPKTAIVISSASISNKKLIILPWQRNILKVLGIQNEIIFVNTPTFFKKVYIPFPLSLIEHYTTEDYFTSLSCVESNIKENKKIYLSRKNITSRGITNQDQIENYALQNGYTVIIPEELDLNLLLEEIASAEEILAIEGSALYNLVFIKKLQATVHIIPRMNIIDFKIFFANKNNVHILDIKNNKENEALHWKSTMQIEISDLDYALKNKKYQNLKQYSFKHEKVQNFIEEINNRVENLRKNTFPLLQELNTKNATINNNVINKDINKLVDTFISTLPQYTNIDCALFIDTLLEKGNYKFTKYQFLKLKLMFYYNRILDEISSKNNIKYKDNKHIIKFLLDLIEIEELY